MGDEDLGRWGEGTGDVTQVVLAVQVDALAGVTAGADGHGVPAGLCVGVGMRDQPTVADGIGDLLRLVGTLVDLATTEAGRGVVDPCPFLVDGFPQAGPDLCGDAFGVQSVGGLPGPVRLLAIDPGQDHGALVERVEAAGGQEGLGGAAVPVGQACDDGGGAGWTLRKTWASRRTVASGGMPGMEDGLVSGPGLAGGRPGPIVVIGGRAG
ncbi:hypothetical protein OG252_45180 [Streptomyces sp. NBC_01352]|uniref:hypothetical protein n=1 Tax=Streptomyces sp. NBC_01352 TaxID=2903834 RepID=UPI002E3568A5|nr:hypothetical protein [Streptomyces sp. NBC_01352]